MADGWVPVVGAAVETGCAGVSRFGPKPVPGPHTLFYFLSVFLFIFHFPFLSFRIPFEFQFNSNPCGEFGLRSNMAVEYSSMG